MDESHQGLSSDDATSITSFSEDSDVKQVQLIAHETCTQDSADRVRPVSTRSTGTTVLLDTFHSVTGLSIDDFLRLTLSQVSRFAQRLHDLWPDRTQNPNAEAISMLGTFIMLVDAPYLLTCMRVLGSEVSRVAQHSRDIWPYLTEDLNAADTENGSRFIVEEQGQIEEGWTDISADPAIVENFSQPSWLQVFQYWSVKLSSQTLRVQPGPRMLSPSSSSNDTTSLKNLARPSRHRRTDPEFRRNKPTIAEVGLVVSKITWVEQKWRSVCKLACSKQISIQVGGADDTGTTRIDGDNHVGPEKMTLITSDLTPTTMYLRFRTQDNVWLVPSLRVVSRVEGIGSCLSMKPWGNNGIEFAIPVVPFVSLHYSLSDLCIRSRGCHWNKFKFPACSYNRLSEHRRCFEIYEARSFERAVISQINPEKAPAFNIIDVPQSKGASLDTPLMVLVIGGILAGKSSIINQLDDLRLGVDFVRPIRVSTDSFHESHYQYSPNIGVEDFKTHEKIHNWASKCATELIDGLVCRKISFLYESTLTSRKVFSLTEHIFREGYDVHLFYVTALLEVAMSRASKRQRQVHPDLVKRTHETAEKNFQLLIEACKRNSRDLHCKLRITTLDNSENDCAAKVMSDYPTAGRATEAQAV